MNSGYRQTVAETIAVSRIIASFLVFPLCVYYYLRSTRALAPEVGCSDFWHRFQDDSCSELARIAVINVGTASADGFFCVGLVASVLLGSMVGTGRWYTQARSTPDEAMATRLILPEAALDPSLPTAPAGWVARVPAMSEKAGIVKYLALSLGLLVSVPYMLRVGQRILEEQGCHENFIKTVLSGPIDLDHCTVLVRYYAMMSFSYPWTVSTWLAYTGWEMAMLCQLLPQRIQAVLIRPLHFLSRWRACAVPTLWDARFKESVKAHMKLWLKSLGIVAFLSSVYPVLSDGVGFANAVLRSYQCPRFFSTFFSSHFVNTGGCDPLYQILGVDAGILKAEVYNAYPLLMLVGLASLVFTLLVSVPLIKCYRRPNVLEGFVERWNNALSRWMDTGLWAAQFFILFAVYAFFFMAIPRANNLLDLSGCPENHYPDFAYFFSESCSASSRSQANMVFISMMWVAVSSSALSLGMLGLGFHGVTQGVAPCARSGFKLFSKRPKENKAVSDSYKVFSGVEDSPKASAVSLKV